MEIKEIEEMIKLMVKYQVEELSFPDGVKIVKKVHALPRTRSPNKVKKAAKPLSPQALSFIQGTDTSTVPDEVLYAVSGPPKNGYSNLKTSNVLPNWGLTSHSVSGE